MQIDLATQSTKSKHQLKTKPKKEQHNNSTSAKVTTEQINKTHKHNNNKQPKTLNPHKITSNRKFSFSAKAKL